MAQYKGIILCRNTQTRAGYGAIDPEALLTPWRETTTEVEHDLTALRNDLNPEVLIAVRISIVSHVWSIDV